MSIVNGRHKGANFIASFALPHTLYELCKRRVPAFGHKSFSAYMRHCIIQDIAARPLETGTYGHPQQTMLPDPAQLTLWELLS